MVTSFRWGALTLASTALISALVLVSDGALVTARGQTGGRDAGRRARFSHDGAVDAEVSAVRTSALTQPLEALAGFTNETNGFDPQGPAFESLSEDTVIALRSFSRKPKRSPTDSVRPTTRRVAVNVIRTS
jgi:hypothetical protein